MRRKEELLRQWATASGLSVILDTDTTSHRSFRARLHSMKHRGSPVTTGRTTFLTRDKAIDELCDRILTVQAAMGLRRILEAKP